MDEQLFWWINSHFNGVMDWTMWCFSQKWCWLIVIALVYGIVTIKKDRQSWLWVLVGIGLCFLLADQISTNAIKDGVQRLRPCHALEGVRMFHTGKGGLYGFVSSHAANAYAVAMFLSLMYGGKSHSTSEVTPSGKRRWWAQEASGYRSRLLPYLLFAWATVVGYSRPYLGKHYPGDVICGAVLGIGVGALVYFVISKIRRSISSRSEA